MLENFTAPSASAPVFPRIDIPRQRWRDGIVVRVPNWLGDAMMALPAIACLRRLTPHPCGLFAAVPDKLAQLFEAIPMIDVVVPIGSGHSLWTKAQRRSVGLLNPGLGFLFVNSLKSAVSLRMSGVPLLFGASSGLRGLLMGRTFKVDWHRKGGYADTHQAHITMAMTHAMGAPKWDGVMPPFDLDPEGIGLDIPWPDGFTVEGGPLLVVAPGAAYGPAKRWPAESFRTVCEWWIKGRGGRVAAVGAPDESGACMAVTAGLPADLAANLAGATGLRGLAKTLQEAAACVTNDSGVMHLAAALGRPGVAVFGSTDPYATGPLGGGWTVAIEPQSCAPCFSRTCVNPDVDYRCLSAVTPRAVIEALEKLR